jgi:hypothetical protein
MLAKGKTPKGFDCRASGSRLRTFPRGAGRKAPSRGPYGRVPEAARFRPSRRLFSTQDSHATEDARRGQPGGCALSLPGLKAEVSRAKRMKESLDTAQKSRREFLEKAGKLAAYTPPTMLMLMYPGTQAIASSGHRTPSDARRPTPLPPERRTGPR